MYVCLKHVFIICNKIYMNYSFEHILYIYQLLYWIKFNFTAFHFYCNDNEMRVNVQRIVTQCVCVYIYIYIYISGGPLSALTCCVNVRLLSGDKKNIAVNLFSKLGWELGLYYASYDDFHPDILARMYT